jgi:putative transcriptional regulator
MKKRNVFAELSEGSAALEAERDGRITLRKHKIAAKPAPKLKPAEDPDIVERLAQI